MFAAAVYALKGFFVQKAYHVVFFCQLLHNFHGQLVVVSRDIRRRKDRRKFVLRGGGFVMFGLCKNAEFPQFFVEIVHKCLYTGFDNAVIMAFERLSLGRRCAE